MKYLSKIFQPLVSTPKNAVVKNLDAASKSQKLLFELGLVRPLGAAGCFALLPLLLRSRDKLCRLVSVALEGAGAQPTVLPLLAPEESWRQSGRLEDAGEELMKVGDRQGRRYILSPTHEELMTELMAELSPISPKQLPLMLYQIGPKFRDEMRPRHGIIRSREFLMKDLYTFHEDEECARRTYHLIGEVYQRIFQEIGVEYIKVEADTGVMGGSLSHEYHYPAAIGEDRLRQCTSCAHQTSPLLHDEGTKCSRCGGNHVKEIMGIEVGHTFLLGTRYSQPLGAHLVSKKPLHMGCYGLGLSRILAASLEALCSPTQLRWPPALAPYSLCIIGPKEGSKEFEVASPLVEKVYSLLQESCPRLKEDILVDDRTHMTIGKRVMEAKRMGYPHILVVGQKALAEPPQFELLDTEGDSVQLLELDALLRTRGLQELGGQAPLHCDGSMENVAQ